MTYAAPLSAGLFVTMIAACIRRLTFTQWLWRSVMDDLSLICRECGWVSAFICAYHRRCRHYRRRDVVNIPVHRDAYGCSQRRAPLCNCGNGLLLALELVAEQQGKVRTDEMPAVTVLVVVEL